MKTPYKQIVISGNLADELNALYYEGWELVQVLDRKTEQGHQPKYIVLLKYINS